MNKLSLSFSCSFLLHGLLILSVLSMGAILPTLDPPMVMDFTLVQGETQPSSKKMERIAQKQISANSPSVVTVLEKPVELPPQKIVEPLPAPVATAAVIVPQKPTELPSREIAAPLSAPLAKIVTKPHVEPSPIKEEDVKPETASHLMVDHEVQPVENVMASFRPESPVENTVAIGRQIYLKQHFQYIKETIQKKICYPGVARKMGWEGKVVISFVVKENGDIQDIKVVESSGYQALDKNAMITIKKAAPFPSPPITAEVIIPVTYQLG